MNKNKLGIFNERIIKCNGIEYIKRHLNARITTSRVPIARKPTRINQLTGKSSTKRERGNIINN